MESESAKSSGKTIGFPLIQKVGAFFSTCCILATGGMASPKSGSDGSGYIYAKSFGHTVKKTVAGTDCTDGRSELVKGNHRSAGGCHRETVCGWKLCGRRYPVKYRWLIMEFLDSAFQVSRYAAVALDRKQCVTATLDFVPEYTEEPNCAIFLKQQLDVASAEVKLENVAFRDCK